MTDIDLDWYRSFLAVYRVGTASGAAQTRFLTQPAITQHIAALETAIGTPLFIRTPRRMVPTERGKELYCHVVQALEKLEQISYTFGQADSSPLVRLGTPLEYFYETALSQLTNLPLRLWVQFAVTQRLVEQLEQDELDLVIATQRIPVRDVEYYRLKEERFVLVGSPKINPPDGATGTDVCRQTQLKTWLETQSWVSYGVEMPIIRRFWQQHFSERLSIQPTFVMPNLHAIARAVELGYGISVLPEYLCISAINAGRLRLLYPSLEPTVNELWLASRKVSRYNAAVKQVQEALCHKQGEAEGNDRDVL